MIRTRAVLTGLVGFAAVASLSTPLVAQGTADITPAPSVTTRHFENSIDRARTVEMRDQYSDFSFDYPESWSVRADLPKDNLNYVEMSGPGKDGLPAFGFSIGWVGASGYAPADIEKLEEIAHNGVKTWAGNAADYRVTSVGPQRLGRHDSYGWQFTVPDPNSDGVFYGRTDLILPPGAMRGIAVVSMVAQRTGEARDSGQVGASGGMKAIFDSLSLRPDKASATRRFVNTPEHARSTVLRDQYVDFSFDFPANWGIASEPTDGSAANFVGLAAPSTANGMPLNVIIGSANGTGNPERDDPDFEAIALKNGQALAGNMADFSIVSIGPQKVGSERSFGWRYTATRAALRNGRPVKVFGRADVLIPPGSTRGVLILAYTTDEDKTVSGPERVGDVGPLKFFYDSFVVGK